MTWQRTPQPEWVGAINDGHIWPVTDVAQTPFDRDRLAGEVGSRVGLDATAVLAALGDDAVEALDVLLPALESEAHLTILGRWITHRFLTRLVEQRLAIEMYTGEHPEVLSEEIQAPWFLIGAPRTGTTILYGLLSQDENNRVPEGWEYLRPVPPPALSDEAGLAARLALADVELQTPQRVASDLISIHEYSGRMPKECLSAMSFAFRSEEFVARYDIPTYERWLRNADMRPAYDVHRRVLQILQHGAPVKRWVLKSPVHLQHVPVIRDVYPDARFSATHRDPVSIIPSVSSLVAQMRSVHSDRVDVEGIGRYHVELYTKTLDRFVDQVDSGEIDPAVLTNSRHTDFLADSMAVTRGLYAHFGWEISAEAAKRMEQHLRDHAEGRAGGTYDLASFGLDADELRARFARYAERFGVASTSK